nr:Lrp/AsnC family transcriptional regulator [Amycolatopsis sp. CA-230715]
MESHEYDELDRKILQALQLDGRASFSAMAEVLDVSGQTVKRRYARLRATGAVRVVGLSYPDSVGEDEWYLRIRATPDATETLARALARRGETTWVHLTSGSTEIVCVTRNDPDAEPALLRKLPQTPRVTSVSAHCILHTFYGGEQGPITKIGPLSRKQAERLRPPPADRTEPPSLTQADRLLLRALGEDGRATYQDLATVTGWSPSTVQRRLTELRRTGVLYFDVDQDPRLLGHRTLAMLWLSVTPASLVAAGQALAEHAEIAFAASTTGPTNLYATISCDGTRALHRYLTGPVATLPGITGIETAPIHRTLKRAGLAPR